MVNRAIAKRPYFETRSDQRYFLARLATEVRAGRLEVHAFCLMTTHYHLLVRSPIGELSEAMRRAQCAYSRYFNRRRRRDGPLIRARFFSKRIDSLAYQRAVVRYIDSNPVKAGIVQTPEEYEFGSARHYLQESTPPWLSTDWVMSFSSSIAGSSTYHPNSYLRAFGLQGGDRSAALAEFIESRMASAAQVDALDDLIGTNPLEVRRWMRKKARLADGMQIGLPVCAASSVLRVIKDYVSANGDWIVEDGDRAWSCAAVAMPGLLVDFAGLPITRIADVCGVTRWRAQDRIALHRRAIQSRREHARISAELVVEAVTESVGN